MSELLAAVVVLRARARYFDQDLRILDGVGVFRIPLDPIAHDADVRVGGEARLANADAEIRAVDTTASSTELRRERCADVGCDCSVLRRSARHRADLAVHELELDVRAVRHGDVFAKRVVWTTCRDDHSPSIAHGAHVFRLGTAVCRSSSASCHGAPMYGWDLGGRYDDQASKLVGAIGHELRPVAVTTWRVRRPGPCSPQRILRTSRPSRGGRGNDASSARVRRSRR